MLHSLLFYKASTLVNCIAPLIFSCFLVYKAGGSFRNRLFVYYCLTVSAWSFVYFLFLNTSSIVSADFLLRTCMLFVILMPALYLHFVIISFNVRDFRNFLLIVYVFTFALLCSVYTDFFIVPGGPFLIFPYWAKPALLFHVALMLFFIVICFVYSILIQRIKEGGQVGNQAAFFLLASIVGHLSGFTNYFVWYRIPVLPFANMVMSLYIFVLVYAVVRFRLMDIRIAISAGGIFVFVYSFFFGLPFFLYYRGEHFVALLCALILATLAPLIYSHLRRKAQDQFLSDQKRYQEALLRATDGLTKFGTVVEIAHFVVRIFPKVMRLHGAAFYLTEGVALKFRFDSGLPDLQKQIEFSDKDLACFERRNVVSLGEHKQTKIGGENKILAAFENLPAGESAVVFSLIRRGVLLGLVYLTQKKDNKSFSDEDFFVLDIIAGNIALAVDNAMVREQDEERRKNEDTMARREFLDHIVSTMSHEIKNPNAAIGMLADQCLNTVESLRHPPDAAWSSVKTVLEKIINNADKVNGLIKKIKRYSQGHDLKIEPVDVKMAVEETDLFWKGILKNFPEVQLDKEIESTLPKVLGDSLMLEQIIVNFLWNAAHAVAQNVSGNKKVCLKAWKLNEEYVRLEVIDNGYGITPELCKILFQVPKTTKSHNEGSGLGLWQLRKICESLGAKYGIDSEGKGKGAHAWVNLRIAKG